MLNKTVWESPKLVNTYRNIHHHLQKPEQTIFKLIAKDLPTAKMLDIGIGTGRTTDYFNQKVATYVGVDYSEPMVNVCRRQFTKHNNLSFKVADVRNLSEFQNEYFDVVLFSYNGLDCIDHTERLLALEEIRRVLKPQGKFIFSSHNLNGIDNLYFLKNDAKTKSKEKLSNALKALLFNLLNQSRKKLKQKDWTIIRDGSSWFKLKYYYIHPKVQIQQLQQVGFDNINAYSLNDGQLLSPEAIEESTDSWIYFLCEKS